MYLKDESLVSAAGVGVDVNWQALLRGEGCFSKCGEHTLAILPSHVEGMLGELVLRDKVFRRVDRSLILAALVLQQMRLVCDYRRFSLIAGSARGASDKLESEHRTFWRTGKTSARASPLTSLGLMASILSQYLGNEGLSLSISSTCATGLHAVGVGRELISSGFSDEVLCVTSEARPTPCVLQMLAQAGVLAKATCVRYPMRPMQATGMVAGEGASAILLSKERSRAGIYIAGYGCSTEKASLTGVSPDGRGLLQAINDALSRAKLQTQDIQLIVGHGAATNKGDAAEWRCYQSLFARNIPAVRFHKWCVGHTLGNASSYSLVMAKRQMLAGECFYLPYAVPHFPSLSKDISSPRHVLVTAMGFGGNSAALILGRE